MRHLCVKGLLCVWIGCCGCTEKEEPAPLVKPDCFELKDTLVLLEDHGKDTIQVETFFDLTKKTSLSCYKVVESERTISENISIAAINKIGDSSWQIVLSDEGKAIAYDEHLMFVYAHETDSARSFRSELLNVRKRFFTHLPVVLINTPKGAEVISKEDWMTDTQMVIYDEQGALHYEGDLSIKGRGNTTWAAPKKPYALKLDSKSEILGMPKHKRWVLLANYVDKTLIRNHIAFYLAKAEGIALEWTPRGTFVDLVFNGKHRGCYYLCEQIKIDENRVNVHENTPEDIDGGYLFEFDQNYDEVNKFRSPIRDLPVMIKEPDEEALTPQQFDYVKGLIAEVEKTLYADDYQEAGLYQNLLDVPSFVDFWLINELTGNTECTWPKSCYMYKDKGEKLKAGPVWDYDYGTFGKFYAKLYCKSSIWNDRLLADPEVTKLSRERWAQLKPEFEKVTVEIDRVKDLLRKSAVANETMWPISGSVVNGDEKLPFDEAVDLLKTKLIDRINWMDANL